LGLRKKKQFSIIILIIIIVNITASVSSIPLQSNTILKNQFKPLKIDWWPMFHHTENQTGFSTSSAPEVNDKLWSYQTENQISSAPNVVEGKVYIGSHDKIFYCLDMTNGKIIWNFTTNGKITGSSAVYDGKVFFGSQDYNFYCLDAYSGNLIWGYEIDYMIESSPTVTDSNVFFGSSDGNLYCLNTNNGSLVWKYSVGNVIITAPAISENRLYFGSVNGDFYCLNMSYGDLIWSYSTNGGIWSSPAIYDDKVYFGSNDNFVYCLDADDGSLIWNFDGEGEVHSSPAIAYGNVYIGARGHGLYCLNAYTGTLVWKYLINNGIWCSPAIADNKIFFGNNPCCGASSYFYCSDAYTGDVIWISLLGGEEGMKSSPAISAGKVIVGAGNGKVIAFGKNDLYSDAHGPYVGFVDSNIQFFGNAYGGRPDYSWHWDFGDGNISYEQNPNHSYSNSGDFKVTLTVTDSKNDIAIDETKATINEYVNYPPEKPIIEGPFNGKIDVKYTFCISDIFDQNGDKLYMYWDWGDSTYTDWSGPFENGQEICENHTWKKIGIFNIRVKLKDEFGKESDWGILEISIPRFNRESNLFLQKIIKQLYGLFPLLNHIIKL
jgi:outer membrane protein assembly factor BamB